MFIPGMPVSTGREAIQKTLQDWLDQNTGVTTVNARTWTKGNQVAVEWVTTGTDKTTGKPWGIDGVSLYTFNDDGLITKDDTYFDVVTMMKQTGSYKDERPFHSIFSLPTGPVETHVAKGDANEDANVAKATTNDAAWAKGDDKTRLDLLSDDYVAIPIATADPRDKKWVKGSMAVAQKAYKDRAWKSWALFGVEDFTIDEGESTYTQAGDYVYSKVKIPNKHKTLTTHGLTIAQWKDGKIVKTWGWGNALERDSQLGIYEAAPKPAAKPKAAPAAKTK
jgi:ketosteroid isomerase-like protein